MSNKVSRQDVKKLALETIKQIQSTKTDSAAKNARQTIKSHLEAPSAKSAEREIGQLASALSTIKKTDSLYWSRYVRGQDDS